MPSWKKTLKYNGKKKTSWKLVGMCFCIITHIWVTILILLPKQHVRLPQHILKACMFCKTWQRCGRPDLWLFCLTCNLQVTGTEIRRAHPKETCCKTLIWVHQITSGHNVGVWDAYKPYLSQHTGQLTTRIYHVTTINILTQSRTTNIINSTYQEIQKISNWKRTLVCSKTI